MSSIISYTNVFVLNLGNSLVLHLHFSQLFTLKNFQLFGELQKEHHKYLLYLRVTICQHVIYLPSLCHTCMHSPHTHTHFLLNCFRVIDVSFYQFLKCILLCNCNTIFTPREFSTDNIKVQPVLKFLQLS